MIIDNSYNQRTTRSRRRHLLVSSAYTYINLSLLTIYLMASQTSGGGGSSGRKTKISKRKGRVDASADDAGAENEASDTKSDKGKAVWTVEETWTLIKFLQQNKAAAGDGGFKASIWHDAARHVNTAYPNAPKDHKQVKRKYTGGVCCQFMDTRSHI